MQATLQYAWVMAGLPTVAPTAADIQAFQLTLSNNGFPSNQVQVFLQLGLTSQDVTNLAQGLISLDPTQTSAFGSFPANLTNQPFISDLYGSAQAATMVALSSGAACAQVYLVKASFGTKIGQPGFMSQADLNGDGAVNVLDLAVAAQNLPPGTTCP